MTDTDKPAQYFTKGGRPGPGRPKGSLQQSTIEIRAFLRSILDSPEYRQRLWTDAVERKLSPAIEEMIWNRVYGVVPRELKLETSTESLPTHELLQRMRDIAAALDVTPTVEELSSGDTVDVQETTADSAVAGGENSD